MDFPPVEEQLALIRRGVEKIVPEEELAPKLEKSRATGTPLRIKYGIDPTGVDLHLGHTVPMRKMRQFQQLGHQAVIIIGNYTALVGDPSGQDETRPRMTPEQVEANAADYLEQVGKVIDLSQAEVVRNGDWFQPMSFAKVLELCSRVTVAQLLTRDDFAKRYREERAIYLHECLYPVMQAWDSVMVQADIELGGTEQLYSFMLARDLQREQGQPQQIGVMSPILVGLDGVRRMGKSLGNYIGVGEPAYEMMKKFMQLPDACMRMYFELLTEVPLDEVDRMMAQNPKEAKKTLAKTIIDKYHPPIQAAGDQTLPKFSQESSATTTTTTTSGAEAAARWQREIGQGELPEDIETRTIYPGGKQEAGKTFTDRDDKGYPRVRAADLLCWAGLCQSKGEARRLIAQGGAYYGEQKQRIGGFDEFISVKPGLLLRAGKKKIVRVKPPDE